MRRQALLRRSGRARLAQNQLRVVLSWVQMVMTMQVGAVLRVPRIREVLDVVGIMTINILVFHAVFQGGQQLPQGARCHNLMESVGSIIMSPQPKILPQPCPLFPHPNLRRPGQHKGSKTKRWPPRRRKGYQPQMERACCGRKCVVVAVIDDTSEGILLSRSCRRC